MSQDTETMSSEDKFLGVRTTITPTEPDSEEMEPTVSDDIDIEVVDDRPEADRRRPTVQTMDDDDGQELDDYSQDVKKRIKKLTRRFHDERRAKEDATRLSDEAINYTQSLQGENQRLLRLVQDSQKALTERSQYGAEAALAYAQENYKKAHESGDSEQIMAAQQHLTNAQLAQASAPEVSQKVIEQWKSNVLAEDRQMRQQQPQQQQYMPEAPEPDPRAVEWQEQNPWFGADKEMTSFAYGVHEKLVTDEGVDPTSEEYYELINKRMEEVFPAHFSSNASESQGSVVVETAPRRKASPVVAPAARNNGAVPRKVVLTSTQVSLAKRLGLTPQQYAKQLLKEMS
jgi:hypothetical protein